MKTRNKILLSVGVVPFIIVVMMMFSMRTVLNDKTDVTLLDTEQINYVKKDFDFNHFENITAEGVWGIRLIRDDNFKVELEAPENRMGEITVNESGGTLMLSSNKNSFSIHNRPRIVITLPSISRLDISGWSDIGISEFKNLRTFIDMNGVAVLTGMNSIIEQLSVTGTGVLDIDMHDIQVTNAHIDYNGFYLIIMHMNGGELSGQLKGVGKMIVSGDISRKTIDVENPNDLMVNKNMF